MTTDPTVRKELDRIASSVHSHLDQFKKAIARAAADTGYAAQFPNDQRAQNTAAEHLRDLQDQLGRANAQLAAVEAQVGDVINRTWKDRSGAAKAATDAAKHVGAQLGRTSQQLRQLTASAIAVKDLRARAAAFDKLEGAVTLALRGLPKVFTLPK